MNGALVNTGGQLALAACGCATATSAAGGINATVAGGGLAIAFKGTLGTGVIVIGAPAVAGIAVGAAAIGLLVYMLGKD